jgi:hypothetical protein
VRVALPLARARRATPVDVAGLPDAERVAAGWAAHVRAPGTLRAELPDGAGRCIDADRALLLVAHDDPRSSLDAAADALDALDRCGHHDTAARGLTDALGELADRRWAGGGRVLAALAGHLRRTGAVLHDDLVGAVAAAAHETGRRSPTDPWTVPGQLAAAEVLDAAGQPEAAARCRRLAADAPAPTAPGPGSVEPIAARLAAALDTLLDDRDGGGVALVPGLPDEWLGQGVEVHDAPTGAGRLSFAVRWHGARPALLWELDAAGPATLRAPRLEPGWSSTEPAGEALLAPVEPAGGLPGVVAPLGADGTPAGAAPEAGTFE